MGKIKQKPIRKLNPFEVHINNEKMRVLGKKGKNDRGLPGVARGKAIKKRKSTLLEDYKVQNKSNRFEDRRIGEQNKFISSEDRLITRFTAIRKKAHKKSIFNLADDEVLTHKGQRLDEIENFDDPKSDDELSLDENETGRLDSNFVEDIHFGGGILRKTGKEGARTHKELIDQLIEESKKRKAEKQRIKEATLDLTEKLDTEWKDLLPLVNQSKKTVVEVPKPPLDEYDKVMRELRFEKRGTVSDRLKTKEEIENDIKENTEKYEKERLERMNAIDLNENKSKWNHRSADDLDDDLVFESDPDYLLSYNEEGESNIKIDANINGKPIDKDTKLGEESSEELSEEGEDDSASEDNLSDLKNDEDTDDVENEDNEEDVDEDNDVQNGDNDVNVDMDEDNEEDVDEDNDDVACEDNDEVESEDNDKDVDMNEDNEEDVDEHNDGVESEDNDEVESKDNDEDLDMDEDNEEDVDKDDEVQSEGNDEDLRGGDEDSKTAKNRLTNEKDKEGRRIEEEDVEFDDVNYICLKKILRLNYIGDVKECLKIFSTLVPNIHNQNQEDIHNTMKDLIKEKHDEYNKKPKLYPSIDILVILKVVGLIFSTSDFRHQIVTPCFIFMEQMLNKCRTKSRSNISFGLFLVTLILEYTNLSKRFLPSAVNFLARILYMAIPINKLKLIKLKPPHNSKINFLTLLNDHSRSKMDLKLKLSDLINEDIDEEFKVRVFSTTLKLLQEFDENFKNYPSNIEIFKPIYLYLKEIEQQIEKYPNSIKKTHKSLLKTLENRISNKTLEHLRTEAQKPKSLRLYEPKIEEVFDSKNYKSVSKEKAERDKLLYKFKKERKGALREIRKDKEFLGRVKIRQQIQSDIERKRKVKEIYAEAGLQQNFLNKKK